MVKQKFKISNKGAEISLLKLNKGVKVTRRTHGLSDTHICFDMDEANEVFDEWVDD